jgi:hypothetical protein
LRLFQEAELYVIASQNPGAFASRPSSLQPPGLPASSLQAFPPAGLAPAFASAPGPRPFCAFPARAALPGWTEAVFSRRPRACRILEGRRGARPQDA